MQLQPVPGMPAPIGAEAAASADGAGVTYLRPRKGWSPVELVELWQRRELLAFLVWRELKVRYKQTLLGAAWALIQPIAAMLVFTFVFGRLAGVPSDGAPYPLFAFSGLLIWTYFAGALTQVSQSVVNNLPTINKIYFPRLLLPLSAVVPGLLDLLIGFALLLVMLAAAGVAPTAALVAAPFIVLVAVVCALGVGLWLAALNVRFRDVRHAVPLLVQFWLFISPVAYPALLVPDKWKAIYAINPMAGVVEAFRWAALGTVQFPAEMFVLSLSSSVALLVSGLFFFRREERSFADVA